MDPVHGAHGRNHILAALPDWEFKYLQPHLHHTCMIVGQVLHEAGAVIDRLYFPAAGCVSIMADAHAQGMVEIGMTGADGFTGTSLLLHATGMATHLTIVRACGEGCALHAGDFRSALHNLPAFRDHCQRYIYYQMVQTAQLAACNARHDIPERLASWLLMSHDMTDGDTLYLEQEVIANAMGIRRAGVSDVLGTFQQERLVRKERRRLTIIDRQSLEERACSCYDTIRRRGGNPRLAH